MDLTLFFPQIATQVIHYFFFFDMMYVPMADIIGCLPDIHSSLFAIWTLMFMWMLVNSEKKICPLRHPCAKITMSHGGLGDRVSRRTVTWLAKRNELTASPFGLTFPVFLLHEDVRCGGPVSVDHHGNYCGLHFEKHCYGCYEIHTCNCVKWNSSKKHLWKKFQSLAAEVRALLCMCTLANTKQSEIQRKNATEWEDSILSFYS